MICNSFYMCVGTRQRAYYYKNISKIGTDPYGQPLAYMGSQPHQVHGQVPIIQALKSALANLSVLPFHQEEVQLSQLMTFYFNNGYNTQAQVLFLYYFFSNLGTLFSSFNQVTEQSLDLNPTPSPRSLHGASAPCSSGILWSLLGGLHRETSGDVSFKTILSKVGWGFDIDFHYFSSRREKTLNIDLLVSKFF